MIRAKPWNGKDLKGVWEFTIKIDGVRAFYHPEDGWISRNGKPLYNIPEPVSAGPDMPVEGFEVYCQHKGNSSKENYRLTISKVRAKNKDRPVLAEELYSLEPLDARLEWCVLTDPSAEEIRKQLNLAVDCGYEGLVLRDVGTTPPRWLKVKPVETYDVEVTGIIEGTGKHKGRMGALMTDMGKVGTGFSDKQRLEWWGLRMSLKASRDWRKPIEWNGMTLPSYVPGEKVEKLGIIIEVECMHLTPDGKFRHPRFSRIRYDK